MELFKEADALEKISTNNSVHISLSSLKSPVLIKTHGVKSLISVNWLKTISQKYQKLKQVI